MGSASPLLEVHELLAREAHLLDDRDFEGWLALFAAECLYWMPVDPTSEDGALRLNVFYDDRAKMEDRIVRLDSGKAYTEEPVSLTARTFAALQIEEADEERVVARSNFQLVAYRSGEQRILGGRYRHRLVREDGELRIAEKRVTLLGSDAPQRPMTFLF
jgi:3-phenylpropionate/cinnamic acid dioxygenase small subunit